MNHWLWPISLVGILTTAVVRGTDMFFDNADIVRDVR